jgi:hypothetical protein
MDENRNSPTPDERGHETTDAEVKPILYFLLSLGILICGSMLLMHWYFTILESWKAPDREVRSPLIDVRQVPPEPRLQSDPAVDLRRFAEEEQRSLNEYRWVDRNSGVFQIPIERAMELIAERGLPYRSLSDAEEAE